MIGLNLWVGHDLWRNGGGGGSDQPPYKLNFSFIFYCYLWLCWTNTTLTCCCAKSSARNNSSSFWWWAAAANKQKKNRNESKFEQVCDVTRKAQWELVLAHTGWPVSRNPILLISRNQRKRHPSLMRLDEKEKRNATNPPLRDYLTHLNCKKFSLLVAKSCKNKFFKGREEEANGKRERETACWARARLLWAVHNTSPDVSLSVCVFLASAPEQRAFLTVDRWMHRRQKLQPRLSLSLSLSSCLKGSDTLLHNQTLFPFTFLSLD